MFEHFGKRLERDIKKDIKTKEKKNEELTGVKTTNPLKVNVVSHQFQRYAVWFGGSIITGAHIAT